MGWWLCRKGIWSRESRPVEFVWRYLQAAVGSPPLHEEHCEWTTVAQHTRICSTARGTEVPQHPRYTTHRSNLATTGGALSTSSSVVSQWHLDIPEREKGGKGVTELRRWTVRLRANSGTAQYLCAAQSSPMVCTFLPSAVRNRQTAHQEVNS